MADKKLNELTVATSPEYIIALDANNNPVRIAKSQLATVLAELTQETLHRRVYCAKDATVTISGITSNGLWKVQVAGSSSYQYFFLSSNGVIFVFEDTWYKLNITIEYVNSTSFTLKQTGWTGNQYFDFYKVA